MTPESQTERERFETWARTTDDGNCCDSDLRHNLVDENEYALPEVEGMWKAWRAALAAHPASTPAAFNVCATMPHGQDTAVMHRALVYSREQAEAVIKQWPEQMPWLAACRMEIRALVYAAPVPGAGLVK